MDFLEFSELYSFLKMGNSIVGFLEFNCKNESKSIKWDYKIKIFVVNGKDMTDNGVEAILKIWRPF